MTSEEFNEAIKIVASVTNMLEKDIRDNYNHPSKYKNATAMVKAVLLAKGVTDFTLEKKKCYVVIDTFGNVASFDNVDEARVYGVDDDICRVIIEEGRFDF